MKRNEIIEAYGYYKKRSSPSWGSRSSSDDFDWGSASKDEFKRKELELELGDEEPGRQRRAPYAPSPRYPQSRAPIAPSSQDEYHLKNTATGKLLSKEGKPSVFTGERHARAVAAKLKFGNWEAVPAGKGVAEGPEQNKKWRDQARDASKEKRPWSPTNLPNYKKNKEQGEAEGSDELYQQAIRKYVQRVANNYLGGGNSHLYRANNFDSDMFGVDPKQAEQDFDKLFPQYVKKLQGGEQGVAESDEPGYIKYEQMKDKIASVLIKLYNQGKDAETIKQMADRVAHHLGYDPEDSIYQDAWMSSFTDASLDGSLDQDDDDYTDWSMRQGERGMEEEMGYDQVSQKQARHILRLAQDHSIEQILDDFPELFRMMEVIAGEHGLHLKDNWEDVVEILLNDLEDIVQQDNDQNFNRDMDEADSQLQVKQIDKATGNVTAMDPKTQQTTQLKAADLKPDATKPGSYTATITDPNEIKPGSTITAKTAEAVHRQQGANPMGQDELGSTYTQSTISGDEDHDEVTKLLTNRLKQLAGLA